MLRELYRLMGKALEHARAVLEMEEDVVRVIAHAISTQLHGQLFETDLDDSWEHYRKMLREA